MSKIPIDLPPAAYPVLERKGKGKGNPTMTFLGVFALCFALIWIVFEII